VSSIPVTRFLTQAAFSGVLEHTFRKFGTTQVMSQKVGKKVNLLIDYPQSLAAGFVAFSYLGNTRLCQVSCIGFIAVPLVLKIICIIANPEGVTHRVTSLADHSLRIAAKWVNALAAIDSILSVFRAREFSVAEFTLNSISAIMLSLFCVKDTAHTAQFVMSSEKNFYRWNLFSRALY